MKLGDDLPQIIPVEVCINFGGGNRLMSEHFLHRAQAGAAFDKVRRKRMPERMRAHVLVNARFFGRILNHQENHDPRQLAAPPVEKHNILAPFLRCDVVADVIEVDLRVFDGFFADGYQSHFITFPQNPQEPNIEMAVRELQIR